MEARAASGIEGYARCVLAIPDFDAPKVTIRKPDLRHIAGDTEHDFARADLVAGNRDALVGLGRRRALGEDADRMDSRSCDGSPGAA